MKWLINLASSTSQTSLAARFRRRRFKHFLLFLNRRGLQSVSILDVGGWEAFWINMGFAGVHHTITLLNLEKYNTKCSNISSVVGDARDLSIFPDNSYDIIFSNSVIEHLSTYEDQMKMAKEVLRVGKHYFIQTPNYYFPIEPHFLFPFFHWLPRSIRLLLHSRINLGFYKKANTITEAERLVDEIRLLKLSELKLLFPEATIYRERILGFTKSFIAYS